MVHLRSLYVVFIHFLGLILVATFRGTFSKRSSIVKGRTFYRKDESLRNYDVDSAEEWEDEEEGTAFLAMLF